MPFKKLRARDELTYYLTTVRTYKGRFWAGNIFNDNVQYHEDRRLLELHIKYLKELLDEYEG